MISERPVRVLLVDDDPQILRFLQAVLESGLPESVRIDSTTDPEVARHYLRTDVIDILVTDLEMPGLDGLELLRLAKQTNAWTQVLLITAHSRASALADAMELGASDYLLKPLDRALLEEVIGEMCRHVRRWRQALAGTLAHA